MVSPIESIFSPTASLKLLHFSGIETTKSFTASYFSPTHCLALSTFGAAQFLKSLYVFFTPFQTCWNTVVLTSSLYLSTSATVLPRISVLVNPLEIASCSNLPCSASSSCMLFESTSSLYNS